MFGHYPEELKGDYAPFNATTLSDINQLFTNTNIGKYVDQLVCINPKADKTFIAIVTWIAPHVLLTARHTLNGLTLDDIGLLYKQHIWSVMLLEDGAQYEADYVLLYVQNVFGHPIKCNIFSSPSSGSYFGCVQYENGWRALTEEILSMPNYQTLSFETTLKAKAGCSGAPYINGKGEMFGFHLSGYEEYSMWNGRVTGITFSQLLANIPHNSVMSLLFFPPITGFFPKPIHSYFFDDDFSLSLTSIGQIDHTARYAALGATPQLRSLTGTQVLLRYFLKNKANPIQGEFSQAEHQLLNLYKQPQNKNFCDTYFSYRNGTPKQNYLKLYELLYQISKWEVLVRMPTGGNLDNAPHQWTRLDVKKYPNSQKAGLQMGHKMGAVDYWAYGAGNRNSPNNGWLRAERIPSIDNANYPTRTKKNEKITSLENRYALYKKPGHEVYGKQNDPTDTFMQEPWNYHFQWWAINQRDGRLAGQKTKYKNYTPDNYKWTSNSKLTLR